MQSSGNYLCFLDADDIMMPDRIAMQYEACKNNPNAIIGSNFERSLHLFSSILSDSVSSSVLFSSFV
uniref:Glycosyltransferase 2-like domain-containing protein n=1 Tax=Arcella intermedia TaxID=1963864 RepID=A0A6B2LWF1_9EUKA